MQRMSIAIRHLRSQPKKKKRYSFKSMASTPQLQVKNSILDCIGNTPLLKIESLSQLSGCEIFIKCENTNPGLSIKDRAALQMITDGIENGSLKKGMTIVEATAGNTGIGLALVAKKFGFDVLAVVPNNQSVEKIRQLELFGAKTLLVEAVPFSDQNHFFHTGK